MERVRDLIHKLSDQQGTNEPPEKLLQTVQLLYAELLLHNTRQPQINTKAVSVILPTGPVFNSPSPEKKEEPVIPEKIEEPIVPEKAEESIIEPPAPEIPQPSTEETPITPVEEKKPETYSIRRPEVIAPVQEQKPKGGELPFNVLDDVPTLAQNTPAKEVHELLGEKGESLNDRLKEEKIEVAHKLTDAPIKDLRKAIGVNDKFLFISQLFRGDEAMYERSIKTINSFHIYPEAEYWIDRELKVKLGWDENAPSTKHFYQLVKRRFL